MLNNYINQRFNYIYNLYIKNTKCLYYLNHRNNKINNINYINFNFIKSKSEINYKLFIYYSSSLLLNLKIIKNNILEYLINTQEYRTDLLKYISKLNYINYFYIANLHNIFENDIELIKNNIKKFEELELEKKKKEKKNLELIKINFELENQEKKEILDNKIKNLNNSIKNVIKKINNLEMELEKEEIDNILHYNLKKLEIEDLKTKKNNINDEILYLEEENSKINIKDKLKFLYKNNKINSKIKNCEKKIEYKNILGHKIISKLENNKIKYLKIIRLRKILKELFELKINELNKNINLKSKEFKIICDKINRINSKKISIIKLFEKKTNDIGKIRKIAELEFKNYIEDRNIREYKIDIKIIKNEYINNLNNIIKILRWKNYI